MLVHFFEWITGIANEQGRWYAFWSGFGSDLGYLGALGLAWHRMNCHEPGCFRIGRMHHEGLTYCKKHHSAHKESA